MERLRPNGKETTKPSAAGFRRTTDAIVAKLASLFMTGVRW